MGNGSGVLLMTHARQCHEIVSLLQNRGIFFQEHSQFLMLFAVEITFFMKVAQYIRYQYQTINTVSTDALVL